MVPVLTVTYAAPASVFEYVAPAPVIEYIAPAPAVTYPAPSQQLPSTMTTVTTGVNLDTTGLVNLQISFTAVEASAPQVFGSHPPLEEFAAPVYDQVHQEQKLQEETTLNIVEIPVVQKQVIVQEIPQAPQIVDSTPLLEFVAAQIIATVQPQVIFQEIPQVQVVERIQEPIVEPIEVLPHERVQQFTAEQRVHMPVPQTQEQSAVTDAVEVVDSFFDDLQYELHVDQQRQSR